MTHLLNRLTLRRFEDTAQRERPHGPGRVVKCRLFGNPLRNEQNRVVGIIESDRPRSWSRGRGRLGAPGDAFRPLREREEASSVAHSAPCGAAARALVQFNGFGIPRAVHPLTPTGYRRGHLT